MAAALLLGGAIPGQALAQQARSAAASTDERITVIGTRLIADVQPERDLNEDAISAYGESTIDGLLGQVRSELGEETPPLVLVNGERVGDLDEIGSLPVEALQNVQVLPRGAAVRAGGTAGQRVVNLTLKHDLKTAILLVAPSFATDGDWHAGRGEANVTYIHGDTRANLTFRGRHESDLEESERGIKQPETAPANLGDFRTLRPRVRYYDLNGNFATRLAPWLTGNLGFRLNQSNRRSLLGLPALAGSDDPLASRSDSDSGETNLSLNGRFGAWSGFFSAQHRQSTDDTKTESDATDPLDPDGIVTDRAKAKSRLNQARLTLTGPVLALPAGDLFATIEGQLTGNRLRSETRVLAVDDTRTFHRNETMLRGALEVPLTSADGFGSAIGDLSASAELSRGHYSDAGNVTNHFFALAWEPRPVFRLSADFEETNVPAALQVLGNPLIVTTGVRVFDPLTGDTVDVTQISGGNPDLAKEKTKVRRVSGLAHLDRRLNLDANAEYTDTEERNFISGLPDASAAVMLAFPSRFIRDIDGTLTTVDIRPVNFDSHREKRFRYGFSLNTVLGRHSSAGPASDEPSVDDSHPPTRLSLTAAHSITFSDKVVIRPGLGSVDLLDGGALGFGSGRVRHQLDGTASITSGGLGLRVTALWRGKTKLNALDDAVEDTLHFSPIFNLNLRAFADIRRFLPNSDWAKGMRLTMYVVNATNDRQEVQDSAGNTPLGYQPGYRDPLGRTIEIELRKVF